MLVFDDFYSFWTYFFSAYCNLLEVFTVSLSYVVFFYANLGLFSLVFPLLFSLSCFFSLYWLLRFYCFPSLVSPFYLYWYSLFPLVCFYLLSYLLSLYYPFCYPLCFLSFPCLSLAYGLSQLVALQITKIKTSLTFLVLQKIIWGFISIFIFILRILADSNPTFLISLTLFSSILNNIKLIIEDVISLIVFFVQIKQYSILHKKIDYTIVRYDFLTLCKYFSYMVTIIFGDIVNIEALLRFRWRISHIIESN